MTSHVAEVCTTQKAVYGGLNIYGLGQIAKGDCD